jgi:SAM-dependent MidA family methyltransferase
MIQSGLLEFLLELQAANGGVIPVDVFMREALYHPEYGYYTKNIRTVGRRGDFATSASLGRVLGQSIAGWIRSRKAEGMGRHVIEVGGGSGAMALTVLKAFSCFDRLWLSYHLVETSPVLRLEQQKLLKGFRVSWHESLPDALQASAGKAMVFSNELIDAFPCRVFERRDGTWCEVGVHIDGNTLGEVLLHRALPPAASALAYDFPDGQRVEVHASASDWMALWSASAREVDLLTIDYGSPIETLYHRRPRGTLRAYFHQQQCSGGSVFQRFGKQDITADVNFSDLEYWGEKLGWKTVRLQSQGQFIREHVSAHDIEHSPADAALADLSGVGDAFQVLHQRIEP